MSQGEGDRKGSVVDPEQPPHVDGAPAVYRPPPGHHAPKYTPGPQVVRGIPVREPLPCCGLGFGWTLFILGFFLGIVPWYIGSVRLLTHKDYRERPGYFACLIAVISLFTFPAILAVIVTIAIIVQLVLNGWLPY